MGTNELEGNSTAKELAEAVEDGGRSAEAEVDASLKVEIVEVKNLFSHEHHGAFYLALLVVAT